MLAKLALLGFVFWLMSMLPLSAFGQAEDSYQSHCSSCHAADGSGATPAGKRLGTIDLRSKQVRNMSDEELFDSIAYGVKHKEYPHAFARRGMSDEQINNLVAYIRKLPAHK